MSFGRCELVVSVSTQTRPFLCRDAELRAEGGVHGSGFLGITISPALPRYYTNPLLSSETALRLSFESAATASLAAWPSEITLHNELRHIT